jgi:hypothetical protein
MPDPPSGSNSLSTESDQQAAPQTSELDLDHARLSTSPTAETCSAPALPSGENRRKRTKKPFVPRQQPPLQREKPKTAFVVALQERQRPDGLLLNWREKSFHIIEFTRAYDPDLQTLRDMEERKIQRYKGLCERLRQRLPDWTGEVVPLTVGIRGTMHSSKWERRLRQLGINGDHHEDIMQEVLKATLHGLDRMFLARNSQRDPAEQAHLPRPGNPDNPGGQDNPPPFDPGKSLTGTAASMAAATTTTTTAMATTAMTATTTTTTTPSIPSASSTGRPSGVASAYPQRRQPGPPSSSSCPAPPHTTQ